MLGRPESEPPSDDEAHATCTRTVTTREAITWMGLGVAQNWSMAGGLSRTTVQSPAGTSTRKAPSEEDVVVRLAPPEPWSVRDVFATGMTRPGGRPTNTLPRMVPSRIGMTSFGDADEQAAATAPRAARTTAARCRFTDAHG